MRDFQIQRLHSVIIPVKDLERSISFYHHVLQLKKGFVDKSMAYFSFGTDVNETTILLHIIDEPEPVDKGMVMELMVNNVAAAVTSIKESGGEIVQEPIDREWGVKEAVIADPDGYKIWMVQPL